MAMSAPRASVFTFESTVHSSHVLRCLDDQRRRDVLCDVTLVVEGRSFRAHRSVLASCSEYFTHRTSCLSPHGAVVTLPREVTVAGFEPLLKFAYTSKLLFGKDSVLEIRNAASVLGFRDLDEACFDFLLPKFFSSGGGSSKGSLPFPRKTCCKKKNKRPLSKEDCSTDSDAALLDEKEAKPVADSTSQQEVAVRCEKSERGKTGSPNTKGTTTPVAEGAKDNFTQCPKYRKFQLACGKDACGAEKSLSSLATLIRDECEPSCSPCSSQNETAQANPAGLSSDGADEPRKTEIHDKKTEGGVAGGGVRAAQGDTNEREDGTKTEEEMMAQTAGASSPDRSRVKAVPVGESTVPGERSPGSIMHRCPLRALAGGPAMTRSWGQERFVCMGLKEDKKPRDSCVVVPVSIRQNAGERVEAEGKRAENAWEERGEEGPVGITEKGTLPVNPAREGSADVGSPQPISQAPDAGRSSDAAGVQVQSSSLEWLKLHVDLAASGGTGGGGGGAGGGCPFLQELDQGKRSWQGAGLSECEGASHSGVSSLNSGEDGDSETETEGDSESYARERARQVQLPFSVAWIVDLSRNDFQQLLKQQALTCEQLEFVHDMRRRSKNRLAAQRCRKRKLDCIYNLQCEINKLKTEREKLIAERSQLSQMKLSTCHSVSALCQRVRSDANLQPEQLRVLAKYASPDCPLTSAFPHTDALLSAPALPVPPLASLSSRFVGLDMCSLAEDARPLSGRDAATGGDRRPL